ncbi:hypothetical protein [Amycolatopsis cihanbeyliensis]|uniref:hypothetical protein n=1 Tax=Amycolatopsis cihanbeyliensis TaxID=1128664 RepID=UPI001153CFC3|nr:hypothetical protein [Amycolatopsis cihanbeyliensis]
MNLRYWVQPEVYDRYLIELSGFNGTFSGAGPDLFEALVRIREKIEPMGWFIAVNGSRLDAFPSGMSRDMAGGEQVYILRSGEPADIHDQVDTLGPADSEKVANIQEQRNYRDAHAAGLVDSHEQYAPGRQEWLPFGFGK